MLSAHPAGASPSPSIDAARSINESTFSLSPRQKKYPSKFFRILGAVTADCRSSGKRVSPARMFGTDIHGVLKKRRYIPHHLQVAR